MSANRARPLPPPFFLLRATLPPPLISLLDPPYTCPSHLRVRLARPLQRRRRRHSPVAEAGELEQAVAALVSADGDLDLDVVRRRRTRPRERARPRRPIVRRNV